MDVVLTGHICSLRKHVKSNGFGGLILDGLVNSVRPATGLGRVAQLSSRNTSWLRDSFRVGSLVTALSAHRIQSNSETASLTALASCAVLFVSVNDGLLIVASDCQEVCFCDSTGARGSF